MISGKRRMTIIVVSVFIGTLLATLLIMSRRGTLTVRDWSTLGINFLFALVIVFAIGMLLRKISR